MGRVLYNAALGACYAAATIWIADVQDGWRFWSLLAAFWVTNSAGFVEGSERAQNKSSAPR